MTVKLFAVCMVLLAFVAAVLLVAGVAQAAAAVPVSGDAGARPGTAWTVHPRVWEKHPRHTPWVVHPR